MANTVKIPRSWVVMGLCLPLAVLVGYLVAEPLEVSSLAVLVLVFSVLCVPLMMKWYHPLLLLAWNTWINPVFLPGRADLWLVFAVAGLFFAVLNRSVNPNLRFINVPSLTKSLLFLLGVVLATGYLRGGFGMNIFGSAHVGGRRYIYIVAAVSGYFALTSQRIPPERVGIYVAMFYLSGLTALVGDLASRAGPSFYFLSNIFPFSAPTEAGPGDEIISRMGGLATAGAAVYCCLLARYGLRGILDFTKPWRILIFSLAMAGCLIGGFRGGLILCGVTLAILFWLEGLHHTRWMPVVLGLGIVVMAGLVLEADRLPLPVQRTLSFLPIRFNPVVEQNANESTEWRVQMWRTLLPQVPKYFFAGKGYAFDPGEMYMDQVSASLHTADPFAASMTAGDYHSGPLTTLIPFGIFGLIGFVWFLGAGLKVLYQNFRYGDPALRQINTFLLAAFLARCVTFFAVFGSFYSDLFLFTGVIGLSVSLNGPTARPEEQDENEFIFNEMRHERSLRDLE